MHLTFRFITQMRGGLISMLYNKATEVALVDVDTASSLTLMSADVERIVTGMETGHEVCFLYGFDFRSSPRLLAINWQLLHRNAISKKSAAWTTTAFHLHRMWR
jgi:hypothetical protein